MFGFRGDRGAAAELHDRLEELERLAYGSNDMHGDGVYFNQAGDLCLAAQQPVSALEYYGQSIDAYVKADRFDAATGVCKKVIRLSPSVVRARCTLAWLALGKGFVPEAQAFIEHYLMAAMRAGRDVLARHQMKRMSVIAEEEPLRMYLAECLLNMGEERTADHLFGAVYRERNHGRTRRHVDTSRRWFEARRCALMSPSEIMR
jgi:hypothetical protein